MKFGFMLILLLVSQFSFAQSLNDIKNKEEMLNRVEQIVSQLEEAQNLLDRQDPETACNSLDVVFELLPDHLLAMGSKMDFFRSDVNSMIQETLTSLMYIHRQIIICQSGLRGQNVDMTKVSKRLKSMTKMLKKQKKLIKKLDTNHSNKYRYNYEI